MNRRTKDITIPLLGAIALLTACTGSDPGTGGTDTSRQYAISFGAAEGQVGQVTRATANPTASTRASATQSLAEQGYNEMKVYGYKTLDGTLYNVMPGYTMKYSAGSANTSTSNSSGWEYVGQGTDYLGNAQEIKYWDGNSSDYRFFGVLPTTSGSTTSYPTLTYKASSSATTTEDVTNLGKTTDVTTDGSFTLTFSGLEYMVRKQVTSTGSDDSNVTNVAYYKADGTTKVEEKDIPIYCHLWQGNPSANYNKPVTLEFVKPYSLIRVVFQRPAGSSITQLGNPDETSLEHDITFGPVGGTMMGSGDVNITYPMTGTEESFTSIAASGAEVSAPTKMSLGTVKLEEEDKQYQVYPEYVMLPTSSNGAFKCTAYIYTANSQVSTGGTYTERTAVIPAQYMQWKPGYQYTYIFKVTANNALEFSHVVEVYTKWQAGYVDETTW